MARRLALLAPLLGLWLAPAALAAGANEPSFWTCGADDSPIVVTDVVLDPPEPHPGDLLNIQVICDSSGAPRARGSARRARGPDCRAE